MLDPDGYAVASWWFVRAVGATAVVAFVSLLVQLDGLFAARGIAPVAERVAALRAHRMGWWRAPSLFWLAADDRSLRLTAVVGLLAAIAATVDLATVPALVVVAVTYLSFAAIAPTFLSFQWDVLLVEVTAVATLVAAADPPPPLVLVLVWVLAARLVFASGVVKLRSGDPTWRGLTALHHHFETQPLPTRLAWYAHQLPAPVLTGLTAATLVVEVGVPPLVATPWPWRAAPVTLLALLQVCIAATGNYGFFNLLSLVLLVPLIPDAAWGVLPAVEALAPSAATPRPGWLSVVLTAAAAALLALHALRLAELHRPPGWVRRILVSVTPFRLVNAYGLFAVMTTARPEIVVEGSDDGRTWQAYRLPFKPQDPERPPRWNAPHQPRLDWQLWFAALGSAREALWLQRFLERLLEASPSVLRLLADDPFGGRPPRYVRALLYDYRFTDPATRGRTGRWWETRLIGVHRPPVTRISVGRDTSRP